VSYILLILGKHLAIMEVSTETGDGSTTLILLPVISGHDSTLELKVPVPVRLSLRDGTFFAVNREMSLEGVGEQWEEALQMFMDLFFKGLMTNVALDEGKFTPNEREQRDILRKMIPDWQRQLEYVSPNELENIRSAVGSSNNKHERVVDVLSPQSIPSMT
jgi:hypothetical protein